ncbi:AAA domain-containing protein [Anaeromyxobacter terrae]|uniref:AAA domain-containing protein n=1 Tax=Anaeromyxobacter terrae TaxID=2925406 RepID=UPI001F59DCB1|nr:AAA domain-containing protein [Anaeromyxobacter sp. SG22]
MTTFHEFLRARLAAGGFSTEDALASFLPLARQVADAHAAGLVAPLDGVAALQVEGARIWFHESLTRKPTRAASEVQRLDRPVGGVEVLSDQRRAIDVERGGGEAANLEIGARDQPLTRPVYLPGYVCWEHVAGHHDPVSDVFSLGLVLASLACGLDLAEPADLEAFVSSRRNLFRLQPRLHPVLAKAIVKMTELSRRDRPQELATLLHNLTHYRDQNVDFDFDLASAEAAIGGAKRPVILGKLQERLFELSRRNRLLHFRSTLGSVNLTHASVPLSFDVQHIRPEQLLTWAGDFSRTISAGEPVSLNRHLDFAEQLYLPSVLDRVRAEARRDAAEFGFEQLRLAICFLRWANLKETPAEHYDSPLVLLPVRLVKKKGVRDSFWLQPLGTEAEVNPVVRHLFRQLHGIELPASLDLAETSLDALFEDLAAKIAASEPGVTLRKVDRPRIDLIHDLAQRRLDRYRRSARLSGRSVRSFLDVDYSYDAANFHPLGLALFRARVKPRPTHLRAILEERPAPRSWAAPPAEEHAPVASREKRFYALREATDDNPYHWDFDLCRVTLGNFKYRKMTLVRDYAELLADGAPNEAFDAVFSLAPRPIERDAPLAPALAERYHVVACDPTQASAIGFARTGASYIIQGPPGTGKSQTITNLVADYVLRGKRVLFVCEKRAAIDVVYARLRQQGLDSLCCLIHDSQADKKEFIQDLKATYERLLAEPVGKPRTWRDRRAALLDALRRELEPLEAFDRAMRGAPPDAGVPLRSALERAVELLPDAPALSAPEKEALPSYADWASHLETVEALVAGVGELQPDGVLAHHPMRLLGPAVVGHERPAQLVASSVAAALGQLEELRAALSATAVAERHWRTLEDALALGAWAAGVEWLARRDLMVLLDERSEASRRLAKARQGLGAAREELARAREGTRHWVEKLPPDEVATALAQAMALEGRWSSVFRPAWWRLRKALRSRYAFAQHAVQPPWSQILTALGAEHAAVAGLAAAELGGKEGLGVDEPLDEVVEQVEAARRGLRELPRALRPLHDEVVRSARAAEVVGAIAAARATAQALRETLGGFLVDFEREALASLGDALRAMDGALPSLGGALHVLGLLARLPPSLAAAFRTRPLTPRQLEAAIVGRCVDEALQTERAVHRLDGAVRERHLRQLSRFAAQWQEANAGAVLERAREAFLERVRIASLPAAELTREQKELKAAYNRGRRDLEHELGKVMRHKSIRDLVAGESGQVVFDLKPVWLMSPLSVSDTLPLRPDAFDVVIFDEASQITLESAVPSIFRAPQAIVVGDEMQLPPTDFFSAKSDGEDEEGLLVGDDGEVFEYDLSANSFLGHAAKNLPSRMLGWHYRSRSESLIGFSNWAFYQGRLLTVPDDRLAAAGRGETLARDPADAAANVARILDRPLSFHLLEHGTYESRRNRAEAAYVAHLVRGLLASPERRSIGIVAFSEAQQAEIESALSALAGEDKAFAERLEAEWEREEDGQFVGLLVKNLENIQGDERDVVILSVCYGRAPDGKMRMNFGPINQSGGEKRLNVAFSRAKHHMCIVSSIRHAEITNDFNDGANCLKSYLRYAEATSCGDAAAGQRVLREIAVWRELGEPATERRDAVVRQIAAALAERGYAVDERVGMSHFRCDLAARRHGEQRHRLGILVDTEEHYRHDDLLERDLMRPQLLRAFGWQVAHVLSSDWYRRRQAVLDELLRLIEQGEAAPVDDAPEDELDDPWAELDAVVEARRPAPPLAAAPPPAPGAASEQSAATSEPAPGTRHFEFVAGASRKFWEVAVAGSAVTVRFGRLGTAGQTQQKLFSDPATAARTADRLVREKLAKGYLEKADAGSA